MGGLATWSNRRLQALWLAWVGLLVCLVVVKLWRQWQRPAPAPISAVPDSLVDSVWRMTADSAAVTTPHGNRLQVLPEQHTDFVYSVVVDDVALLKTVLLLLGPPGLLTALWLYLRHSSHRGPPT